MAQQLDGRPRKSALVIVDFQNDFASPDGSLSIKGGLDIDKPINELMNKPWALRVATQDWHPKDHVSFASNHPGAKPFETIIDVVNPADSTEVAKVRLWPDHCIQDSVGAQLVPSLDLSRIDSIIKKGQDRRVEMFSAFRDSYKVNVTQSSLLDELRQASISDVYCVGLAFDCCVKETALHAAQSGFRTFIVEEGTRAGSQAAESMKTLYQELRDGGVSVISITDIKNIRYQDTSVEEKF